MFNFCASHLIQRHFKSLCDKCKNVYNVIREEHFITFIRADDTKIVLKPITKMTVEKSN